MAAIRAFTIRMATTCLKRLMHSFATTTTTATICSMKTSSMLSIQVSTPMLVVAPPLEQSLRFSSMWPERPALGTRPGVHAAPGGALAIAVGDHIAMLKYATYSVASPEACASIIWRDSEKASEAAEAMQVNAENILKLKLIDEVIDEPLGGAHRNPDQAALLLKKSIIKNLDHLKSQSISTLVETRYKRLMSYGHK